jgi:hypothetical protein
VKIAMIVCNFVSTLDWLCTTAYANLDASDWATMTIAAWKTWGNGHVFLTPKEARRCFCLKGNRSAVEIRMNDTWKQRKFDIIGLVLTSKVMGMKANLIQEN